MHTNDVTRQPLSPAIFAFLLYLESASEETLDAILEILGEGVNGSE